MSSENVQFRRFTEGEKYGNIGLSQKIITALQLAEESRLRLNHDVLGAEHILIGVMESPAGRRVFDNVFNCDVDYIGIAEKQIAETMARRDGKVEKTDTISEEVKQAIQFAVDEARRDGVLQITDQHLLKGILKTTDSTAAQILEKMGIDTDLMIRELFSQ